MKTGLQTVDVVSPLQDVIDVGIGDEDGIGHFLGRGAPDSRMWYPLTLTGFTFGMVFIECSMVSPMRFTAGSTGKIHAPLPIISLRMSFWGVADMTSGEYPVFLPWPDTWPV